MLLLTGPPGSGRTSHVLGEMRGVLRRRDSSVRLLTPTATMAEHLGHTLAREGFVLRPNLIQTLSKFIAPRVEDLPEITKARFYLLVDQVARKLAPPEFTRVLRTPGFTAALAQAIEEFSSAGCDAAWLQRALPPTLFGPAFVAVYRQVERELARRSLTLRAGRLALAAQRIASDELAGVHTVWMDGFFALSDPELDVVRAIGAHAELTVTLPEGPGATRQALLDMGFVECRLERRRAEPAVETFSAPTVDREAAEIARRILKTRSFGQTGIVVRNPDIYLAPLRAALERFGIPARFYFSKPLSEYGPVKFLSAVMVALIGGWDHSETLAALRRSSDSAELDRFDFEVREGLPGMGLDGLRRMAADARLRLLIDQFAALDPWRSLSLAPEQWAKRLGSLRVLVRPPRPEDDADFARTTLWRGQASALAAWEAAMAEAAGSFDRDRRISLVEFWEAAQAVVRLSPLEVADRRRNVVRVLSVYEARQWELPAVFMCGLAEQQFPKRRAPEPLFSDAVKSRLAQGGIRVPMAAELEREERFLFELARTRATGTLTLSFAEADSRGIRNMASQFLEREAVRCDRTVRPEPEGQPVGPAVAPEIRPIRTAFGPSSLECFLDCPFQYFARHTLRLATRPPIPRDRLDFLVQGRIMHQTIAEWHRDPQPIEPLFDRIFAACCEKEGVVPGYRTEYLRRQMLDDLRQFEQQRQLPVAAQVSAEEEFTMRIDDSLTVRGRIDRIDTLADGRALIVDYKYSGAANVADKLEKPTLLQAGLYALAVERTKGLHAAGVFYYGLKRNSKVVGWSDPPGAFQIPSQPLTRAWIDAALELARTAADQIRAGRVAPAPSSLSLCRLCEFRDVCRYDGAARTLAAG